MKPRDSSWLFRVARSCRNRTSEKQKLENHAIYRNESFPDQKFSFSLGIFFVAQTHNQNPVDLCRRDFGFFGSLGDTIRRPNTASRTISPLPAFLFLEKLPAGIRNVFKASQKTCCSLPVSPNGFLKLITSGELWARMNNAEKFERN